LSGRPVIYPRAYSEIEGGTEPCQTETQCLALGGPLTSLSVKVRCLRLVERTVGYLREPVTELVAPAVLPAVSVPPELPTAEVEASFVPAPAIEVDGRIYESWQEAAECDLSLPPYHFVELAAKPTSRRFAMPATRTTDRPPRHSGLGVKVLSRSRSSSKALVAIGGGPRTKAAHVGPEHLCGQSAGSAFQLDEDTSP
jgi:hypothetical protein